MPLFLSSFFVGVTFLPAALFDFVCFFLVFFLAAIRAVYRRHKCGTKPRWIFFFLSEARKNTRELPPLPAAVNVRRRNGRRKK